MKIITGISILALFFIACNEIKEEDNIPTSKVELLTSLEETEEETKETKETKDSVKPESKVLLVGRGSEPGWSAEFYPDKVKLSLEHGEIQEEIAYDFSNIASEKVFKLTLSNITSSKGKKEIKKFSVVIEKESCKEESTGEIKDRKIFITFNDKSYSGCAGN